MLYGGEIYQLNYDDIKRVFKNHYKVARKLGISSQGLPKYSPSTSVIKHAIGNMLEDFKNEMLHTFSLQMDTMHINKKQMEVERALSIFFSICIKRHPINECPLNVIQI